MEYQKRINEVDWSLILNCNDVNVGAYLFRKTLIDICNELAPWMRLKLRDFAPPWLNSEYLALIDAREYWCGKYKKSQTLENLQRKVLAISTANTVRNELKVSYFEDQIKQAGSDSKSLWKAIKQILAIKIKK